MRFSSTFGNFSVLLIAYLNTSIAAQADTTAKIVSEMAAAPTLMANITFIFASDVPSSTWESSSISTPISNIKSTTCLLESTSTKLSSTAYATYLPSTTSEMATETVSTPCTTSLLKSTSTLNSYIVSSTSSPAPTTSTIPANDYTTSVTSSLNTTTTSCKSTPTIVPTTTACITSKPTANTTVTVPESTSPVVETSTSCSLSSSVTTNSSTPMVPNTASQYSASQYPASQYPTPQYPALQYPTTVPAYSTGSASQTSSPCLTSSVMPAYNTSSAETTISSPLLSVYETSFTILYSASPPVSVASESPIVTESPSASAPVVTMMTGFLVPSNTSVAPVQRTDLQEFVGVAARGVHVPRTQGMLVWLVVVLGFFRG